MIIGKEGNIVVSNGEDGMFFIDNKRVSALKPLNEMIEVIGAPKPSFIINTRRHIDNKNEEKTTKKESSLIVSQEDNIKQLTNSHFAKRSRIKKSPKIKQAMPTIVFTDDTSFNFNQESIQVRHIKSANTDSNGIVFFKESDVLHTGDLFFNGSYPIIDTKHGGSLKSTLETANTLVKMAGNNTQIIPGRGPLADKKDLIHYRNMLQIAYKRLSALKRDQKTLEQTIAAAPLKDLDAEWSDGDLKTEQWIRSIYNNIE